MPSRISIDPMSFRHSPAALRQHHDHRARAGWRPKLAAAATLLALGLATPILLTSASCVSMVGRAVIMTPELIEREGTRRYAASYAQVFTAAEAGLMALGFEIRSSAPQSGVIVTKERVREAATSGTSVAREYYVLTVEVDLTPDNHSRVRVTPERFTGMEKTLSYATWSAGWLEHHWDGLFQDIAARVGVPALPATAATPAQEPREAPLVIGR